jgi:hypothetical protein
MENNSASYNNALETREAQETRLYEVQILPDVPTPEDGYGLYRLIQGDRLTVDSAGHCELIASSGKATGTINRNYGLPFVVLSFESGPYASGSYVLRSATGQYGIAYVFGDHTGVAPGVTSNYGPGGGTYGNKDFAQGSSNLPPREGSSNPASDQLNFTLKLIQ